MKNCRNIWCFWTGISWCVLICIVALTDVGRTIGPVSFTAWDAVLVSFMAGIMPFLLGLFSRVSN